MIDFYSFVGKHAGQECVIYGNGQSLEDHWPLLTPAKRIILNQGWKMLTGDPDADYAICVDKAQYDRDEPGEGFTPNANKLAFQRLDERRILFTSEAWRDCQPRGLGIPIPMLGYPWTWGNLPGCTGYRSGLPQGAVVSVDGTGTVMYVALQIAEMMGFSRIWLAGFDQAGPKFTGEVLARRTPPETIFARQDWLFGHVPKGTREKVRAIAPSKTTQFQIVEEWPWR